MEILVKKISMGIGLAFLTVAYLFAIEGMYVEKTGEKVRTNTWIKKADKVIVYNDQEFQSILITDKLETLVWVVTNFSKGVNIIAERKGNTIKVEGNFEGKPMLKEYKIDEAPWYEFLEVSLKDFVRAKDKEVSFWTIRPTDFTIYKMKAVKEKEEKIVIGNNSYDTVKIKVTLVGFASLFWSASYWYDKSNGDFLKYEAVLGGPGTPKTIVEKTQR